MAVQALLASWDELRDHVSDSSQAAQRGSLVLYWGGGTGGRDQSLARRTEEKHI